MIDWKKHFDRIYCVHYLPYGERREKMESELRRVGILDSGIFSWRYTWDSPFYDELAKTPLNKALSVGYMKCGLAHYFCVKEAYELGYERILLLEDDIAFLNDLDEIERILNLSPADYDLVLYDNMCIDPALYQRYLQKNRINEGFCSYDRKMQLASCYAMSRKFMKYKITNEERALNTNDSYNSGAVDTVGGEGLRKAFAVKLIACQNPNAGKSLNADMASVNSRVKPNAGFYEKSNHLDYSLYNTGPAEAQVSAETRTDSVWDGLFDAVYCIHYIPNKERLEPLKRELRRVGILDSSNFRWKYTWKAPSIENALYGILKKDKRTTLSSVGRMNCALAHYSCIKEAYESGMERILILENDIRFLNDLDHVINAVSKDSGANITLYDNMPAKHQYGRLKVLARNGFSALRSETVYYASCYSLDRKAMAYIIRKQEKLLLDSDGYTCRRDVKEGISVSISVPRIASQAQYEDSLTNARDGKDASVRYRNTGLVAGDYSKAEAVKKKIVFLSMSCNKPLYVAEEAAVRETWAKDIIDGKYPNMEWFSYAGGKTDGYDAEKRRKTFNVNDGYGGTFAKTVKMMKWLLDNSDFEYLVRTNTSNYINVPLVDRFISELPKNDRNTYVGEICCCPWFRHRFYGRGIFLLMSRELVEAVVRHAQNMPEFEKRNFTDDYTIFDVMEKELYTPKGAVGKDYLKQVPCLYMNGNHAEYSYDTCSDKMVINVKSSGQDRKYVMEKLRELHKAVCEETGKFIVPCRFNEGKVRYIGTPSGGYIPYAEALRRTMKYYGNYQPAGKGRTGSARKTRTVANTPRKRPVRVIRKNRRIAAPNI